MLKREGARQEEQEDSCRFRRSRRLGRLRSTPSTSRDHNPSVAHTDISSGSGFDSNDVLVVLIILTVCFCVRTRVSHVLGTRPANHEQETSRIHPSKSTGGFEDFFGHRSTVVIINPSANGSPTPACGDRDDSG
jgi:hypothetical protein